MDRPVGGFLYDFGDFRVDSMQRLPLTPVPPEAEPVPAPVPVPQAVPHSRVGRLGWTIGLLAAAVIVGAAIWWFRPQIHEPSASREVIVAPIVASAPSAAARGLGKVRLAVLPFQNLSPDPRNAFFADGLHEEILSTLGERLRTVQVISRTTMMSDRLKAQPIATVASILGATHVIEGSVRREGRTVRLSLQLQDFL